MLRNLISGRLRAMVGSLCAIAFAYWAMGVPANEAPAGKEVTPPEAPGYNTRAELLTAIVTGKIRILTWDVEVPADVEFIEDIEYGKVGQRSLKLDLYRARKHDKRAAVPGLIFIHGGGWRGGDKEVYRVHASRCAQRGYVVVSVGYRLSGEAPFPAAVEDVKCAVRWMRAKGSEYGIDPDNIAILGGSAGGHLAMMVGYSSDVEELEGTGGHQGVSSRVQAVVNLYGPCDLTVPFAQKSPLVWQFLGGKKYQEAPDLYERASPIHYLTKDDPPTLILHGTLDETVPINQSDILAAKLKELGLTYTYDRLAGWPHTMDAAEIVFKRCAFLTDRFLAEHMPVPGEKHTQP